MTPPSFTGPDTGSTSALLLMDVQNDMVDPEGKLGGTYAQQAAERQVLDNRLRTGLGQPSKGAGCPRPGRPHRRLPEVA